jgi:hypothetical protein
MRSFRPVLFSGALLFLGALPRHAEALSFGVGPKLGANFGSAEIDDVNDVESRTGLAVGAMAEFGVTSPFSLVLEPMYLQRGARFDVLGGTARGDFNYLEVPILAKAKFGSLNTAHAYLFLGPSLGFLMSSEGRYAGFTDDFEDQVGSFAVSGEVGVGAAYKLRPYTYLSADVRYAHGFTDVLDEDIVAIDSWNHRDVRLMLGLLIHLTQ